jgi:hypothetical protein
LVRKKRKESRGSDEVRNSRKEMKKVPISQCEYDFTPLNTSVTEIFMEIKREPDLRWRTKVKTPLQRRDYQKYCEYHSSHGHNIEECVTLHFEI